MFKSIIMLIMCTLLFTPIQVGAESFVYTSPTDHYYLAVPDGWTEITKATLDSASEQVAEQSGAEAQKYSAGFQVANVQDFQYPYILTQKIGEDSPSYDEILKQLGSNQLSDTVAEINDNYSEIISNASIGQFYLDKDKNTISTVMESDVVNVGKIKALLVIFLGKESAIGVYFYSLETEYINNYATFDQIINSFEYDEGYKYDSEYAKYNDQSGVLDRVLQKGLMGGFAGILLGSVAFLINRSKKKKEKVPDTDNPESDKKECLKNVVHDDDDARKWEDIE